jgi:hypothetical protein
MDATRRNSQVLVPKMWNYKSDICCTPILEPVIQALAASFRDDVIAVELPGLNLAAKLDPPSIPLSEW